MTRRPLSEAIGERDVTRALTPTQLFLLAVAAFVGLRILRALRYSRRG